MTIMYKKLLVALALYHCHAAIAQQDSTFTKQLDQVVVTATKFPTKSAETGKVITIIDQAVLGRSLGKDLAQVLTEQAGLVVNGATSNPGKDKSVFLRGAKNDYTVILVNGIPVTDPSGVGGAFDLRLFPIEQIERIEILKGAQSTLYGSDAVAGVINIITRKGVGKPAQLYGNASFGSFDTKKFYVGLNGQAEKTSYHVGFTHHESDGISEAADTTAAKSFDKDGFLQHAFQFGVDAEVLDGLQVKPFFRYSYFSGDFDDGSFADADNTYKATLLSTGAIATYKFNNGSVTAQFAYDEMGRIYNTSFGTSEFDGRNKLAEVYGQYNFSDHFQLLAGIDHRKQKMLQPDTSVTITSPYASVFLKNLGGFNMEAGLRYNDHNHYGNNTTYSINPSWLVNRNVKLFVNLASAFKAPTLNALYGPFGANPDLKPEKSRTIEGGVQASFFDNLLQARVVYFQRHTKDMIIYGPAFSYLNLDEQDDHGIEIEPTIQINNDLQVKLYYTYLDGELTTKTGGGKDTSFNNLIRRPKHSFGATVNYQVTKNFFISTNIYSYGKRDDLFFDMNTFSQQPVTLKAYMLWNAYAQYSMLNNRLRLFVDVKNITGSKYEEVYGYSTQKFNATAGLAVKL
jgi:vitamin B12 transporter